MAVTTMTAAEASRTKGIAERVAKFLETLRAAQRAAHDFEYLSGQSDVALIRQGMHRADLARTIYARHFG